MKDRPRVTSNLFGVLQGILDRLQKLETSFGNGSEATQAVASPVLSASITSPGLGVGGLSSSETSDDGWISGNGLIQFGSSGVSAGNGTYRISLPASPAALFTGAARRMIGSGISFHTGNIVDVFAMIWSPAMGSAAEMWSAKSPGNPAYTSSNPWTWVANDYILYTLRYPRA